MAWSSTGSSVDANHRIIMPLESYFSEDALRWFVIPVLIFLARLTDVTIGTLRLIFTARGLRQIAPVLGFFEVLIWIVAMSQIMRYADNWPSYLAWAGGFAAGNYTGLKIEERLALGNLLLRVITALPADELMEALRSRGYGVTLLGARGSQGDVSVLFTLIKRKNLKDALSLVHAHNPNAFYTVEDVRHTSSHSR
jgi:uncharacterized protein YebE (UPF0316 family)